jgi:hypothetical protein
VSTATVRIAFPACAGIHHKSALTIPEQFNLEKLDRSARICSQILAAKCLQAGFARR